jgi:signal transduction histidine kinase
MHYSTSCAGKKVCPRRRSSPSVIDRIFNPLFTTKAHGMGMGLSICRSIIEANGGQLWVTANLPRGTIFHFTRGP